MIRRLPNWTPLNRIRPAVRARPSKLLLQTLEGIVIAALLPRHSIRTSLRILLGSGLTNRMRVAHLLHLFDKAVPNTAERISRRLCHGHALPFANASLQPIAFGHGSTVFRMRAAPEPSVLKIYRRSLGGSRAQLLQVARSYRAQYQMLRKWYNTEHDLILPSDFLLVHGPLLGRPVAACLQPYIAGEKSDLFLDYTDDELARLLQGDRAFREQLLLFIEQTERMLSETGKCFDLVGRENLMVVESQGRLKLLIADYGVIDVEKTQPVRPDKIAAMETRLARLRALYERMTGETGASGPLT